jgi:hypothetical protein
MNKDDIVRMAKAVDLDWNGTWDKYDWHSLAGFANLVATAENEACAKICAEADKSTHPADLADTIRARMNPTKQLVDRITQYLSVGGLFNPELMEHQKVRDLLIDCRKALNERTN